ncbi:MAG: EpsG family protein, partial [Streptococcus mitis]|nr:EpsG family protein [Streptococcus mitis]
MTIYLLMFVYISFLAFFSSKYEDKEQELRFLVLPTLFFFLIIAGFRTSSVGGDLGTYIHIFESNDLQLPDLSHLFSSRFELGYLVSNIFLRNFSEHYPFLLFSYAFITLIAWFLVLYKHSKNVYMSLLIYFSSLGLFFYSLSNIRQGLAIALSFLGFHYVVKNKKILAWVFILLTPLFHTSGIVCLLFFPLKKIVLNKRIYQFVFLAFLIILPFIKQIATIFISFFPQYTSYLESSWFLESNKWAPVFLTIWYGIVLIFGELVIRKQKLSTEEEFIRTLFFISFLFTASTL